MCRLGLIASFMFIFSITSCQKDATTNPLTETNTEGSKASTLTVDAIKATSLAISYTGFPTSWVTASPINLNGSHDITISGEKIAGGNVPPITLSNCYNVHITKNKLGNSTAVGIYLINCKNITIDYNYIYNVSTGVYVENSSGGGLVVNNNQIKNVVGPTPRGQFVQFNTVSGPNNIISNNACENIAGYSNPIDGISLFMSNGTAASPIEVNGNWIRGGGPSNNGSGIMLGDYGGSYEVAANNILVNPGQVGIAIAGGDHMTITGNTIFAKAQSFTNVGIYVWGQAGYAVTNSNVSYNKVKFMSASNQESDDWLASGTPTPTGWSTNTFGANITSSILPAVITTF